MAATPFAVRDPERIPLILAAVERRWRQDPDLRLGQLLTNLTVGREIGLVEDGALLKLLGPETDEERRYVAAEAAARREGWRDFTRRSRRPGGSAPE
jgi:hypothetical protein